MTDLQLLVTFLTTNSVLGSAFMPTILTGHVPDSPFPDARPLHGHIASAPGHPASDHGSPPDITHFGALPLPISTAQDPNARMEALESRLTHQEDWLETLDRTLITQQRQIEMLERQNALLAQQLRALRDQHSHSQDDAAFGAEDISPQNDLPPHY